MDNSILDKTSLPKRKSKISLIKLKLLLVRVLQATKFSKK
jgi:hypothetical protein